MSRGQFELHPDVGDAAPALLWRTTSDGRCEYVNRAFAAFTGRTPESALGEGWLESVHPADRAGCVALFRDHASRAAPLEAELRLRRHDGVYRYLLVHGAPESRDDGSAGIVAGAVDIDDRRTDADIAVGLKFFEMSLDILSVAGFDGYLKRINSSWTKTLGWTREELMSRPSIEFVHPDDREATLRARAGLKVGVPLIGLVNRYLCKDGTYRWFEWRSVGHVERQVVYAAARDVTEQKEAQRVLRDLNENLTATLESIVEGVIVTDASGAIVRMNPVAEKLSGWALAEARGRPLEDVLRVVDAQTRVATSPVARALREGVAVERTGLGLVAGGELAIATSCAPMRDPDGAISGAVLVLRDMTAEREAQAQQDELRRQLILSDRLASVGTLASGVAHEINNPLTFVTSNTEMLIERLAAIEAGAPTTSADAAELAEMARDVRQGAVRIYKVVRGLKTFAQPAADAESHGPVDVRAALELSIDLVSNQLRHRARLVTDFEDVPHVEADDARLGQVFVNLLVNAVQAIPDGDSDAHEIRVVTSTDAEGRAVIEVSDTGSGVPEGVIGRVFDPFFTTKPVGAGTGLGLSICHNIVTSLGGRITAENREAGGARFRITLPPSRIRPSAKPPPSPRASLAGRPAHVLVVDDEVAIGGTLSRVLRDHHVTAVTRACEALDLILSGEHFDVVLSDLMMPEMSGMELYAELRQRRPEVAERVVFITGGAFTPAARAFIERVSNERLEKPLDPVTLRELVARFVK